MASSSSSSSTGTMPIKWQIELKEKTAEQVKLLLKSNGVYARHIDSLRRNMAHEICLIPDASRRILFVPVLEDLIKVNQSCLEENDYDGYFPMHMAAQLGDTQLLMLIHKYNLSALNMASKNVLSRRPIHFAAQTGSLESLKYIVERFPQSVKLASSDGRYPLHLAALSGHIETIQYLYGRYPEVIKKRTTLGGFTCLFVAAEFGNFEASKYFFERFPEAATLKTDQGQTILSITLCKRFFAISEYLIAKCPQTVSIPAEAQKIPLHQASLRGHSKLVQLLIDVYPEGARVMDADGYLPIHGAAQSGNLDTFLIVKNAFPDGMLAYANSNGRTPLHFCAQDGHLAIVDVIIKTCMSYASVREKAHDFVSDFIAKPSTDDFAVNCFYSAVYKGHTNVCLRLLEFANELLPVEGPKILARSLNMPERNTPFHALFLRCLTEDSPSMLTPTPFFMVDPRLFMPLLSIYPQASIVRNNRGETPLSLHIRFDEFYRCFQNAQQRLLQAYMLRLHMSKNLDHHVSTRRDLNWSCRAVAFRITSAGLQCCRPSSVPTKDEDATTSIDGIESTISELKALRLSPAAVFALFKNQSEGGNRVLHVADKKNLLSNIWLASFDVWKLIVMYF